MFSNAMNFTGVDHAFVKNFQTIENRVIQECAGGVKIVTERGFPIVQEIDFEGWGKYRNRKKSLSGQLPSCRTDLPQ